MYSRIYAQRYLSDGSPLGNNFRISTEPQSSTLHYDPSVALHNGIVYTAWTVSYQDTVYYRSIWANIIDFYDPPLNKSPTNDLMPTSFYLYQNYPNPFNPTTTIKYETLIYGYRQIFIFDLLGRNIATLASGPVSPGIYQVQWNGRDNMGRSVPSGLYLVRLSIDGQSQSIMTVLLR